MSQHMRPVSHGRMQANSCVFWRVTCGCAEIVCTEALGSLWIFLCTKATLLTAPVETLSGLRLVHQAPPLALQVVLAYSCQCFLAGSNCLLACTGSWEWCGIQLRSDDSGKCAGCDSRQFARNKSRELLFCVSCISNVSRSDRHGTAMLDDKPKFPYMVCKCFAPSHAHKNASHCKCGTCLFWYHARTSCGCALCWP